MLGARLCDPWPLDGCCDFVALGISPAVTGIAHEAATEFLWMATGQQFGNCSVALRPCRKSWFDQYNLGGLYPPIPIVGGGQWDWPFPALYAGEWINIGCGLCGHDCSCTRTSEILFPDPVTITSIIQDGVTLAPSDWILYDHQKLVRHGTDWPLCQDWTVTGGPGTLIVNATVGGDVPALGQLAVGKLTCELAKSCVGIDCELPPYVTAVTRSGVTMQTMVDLLAEKGLTGLLLPDLFIKRFNPEGLQDRARAYSPDAFLPRTVT